MLGARDGYYRQLLGLLLLCCEAAAQKRSCPAIAVFPVDSLSAETRARFELRQCPGGTITVNGYERNSASPSLTFDTGDAYPSYLVHSYNLLVLQSSAHIYVFSFRQGKPALTLNAAAEGEVQVKQSGGSLAVTVPIKNGQAPDKVYVFPVEH